MWFRLPHLHIFGTCSLFHLCHAPLYKTNSRKGQTIKKPFSLGTPTKDTQTHIQGCWLMTTFRKYLHLPKNVKPSFWSSLCVYKAVPACDLAWKKWWYLTNKITPFECLMRCYVLLCQLCLVWEGPLVPYTRWWVIYSAHTVVHVGVSCSTIRDRC